MDVFAFGHAIASTDDGDLHVDAVLRPFDPVGTTRYVDFDTTRAVYKTDPAKCHISHVVADTDSWEQKMAQVLEDMRAQMDRLGLSTKEQARLLRDLLAGRPHRLDWRMRRRPRPVRQQ